MCKTWAPAGQTPYLRHRYRHDRLSSISAITVSPKAEHLGLYVAFHRQNISGVEVLVFLRQLLRHLRGQTILLWDSAPIHRRRLVQDFLARHQRLHVYRFPGYAPELNPDEWVWQKTKHALCNRAAQNLQDLYRAVLRSVQRIQRSQKSLWSCIWASKLPWR